MNIDYPGRERKRKIGIVVKVGSFSKMILEDRLLRIEALLEMLVERQQTREWYSTDQAAQVLKKAEFTVREWCRLGRIRAEKRKSGRGAHAAWVISHTELLRIQKEGLLPDRRQS
jgi:hypothetical protein